MHNYINTTHKQTNATKYLTSTAAERRNKQSLICLCLPVYRITRNAKKRLWQNFWRDRAWPNWHSIRVFHSNPNHNPDTQLVKRIFAYL